MSSLLPANSTVSLFSDKQHHFQSVLDSSLQSQISLRHNFSSFCGFIWMRATPNFLTETWLDMWHLRMRVNSTCSMGLRLSLSEDRIVTPSTVHQRFNSSEAKASRVIICKFPVKLRFRSIVCSREPRSPDTCIPTVSRAGWPVGISSSAHVSIRIQFAFSDNDCIRQRREIAQ